ncbi:AIR synthase-related protein, partial [Pseudoalteromonas sp. SIMBA_148]
VTGENVAEGDVLIALASSGAHSNGYSLVRKVIEVSGVDVTNSDEQLDGQPIQDALMAPTRIYVKAIKALQDTLGSSAL